MDQWTLWLSLLSGVVLVLVFAPGVLAFNRGKIVRNIAVWLAIFVLLGWVYKAFGPFGTVIEQPIEQTQPEDPTDTGLPPADENNKDQKDTPFNPPQEL